MRVVIFILLLVALRAGAATLNVTNYGVLGDTIITNTFNTVSNSAVVTTTGILSASDVGKVISIFGAGPKPGPTNYNSDVIAVIQSVSAATNITLDRVVSNTTNGAYSIYGTLCSTGFQACINAASGGDTISIPAGKYLLIPQAIVATNYVGTDSTQLPAVTISKGGLRFVGAGATNTILYGNGAWRLYPEYVVRGFIFMVNGPITNSYELPFSFQDLTMDGGVIRGRTDYQGFPANNNGDGWDVTHGAYIVRGVSPPFHTNTAFVNCNFQHWRGEMLKTVYDYQSSNFIGFTNCQFIDGNASALNWQIGGHVIEGCTFTNTKIVMEFYSSVSLLPCYFQNNNVTNCSSGVTVTGAMTNRQPQASYTIRNNTFNVLQWGVNAAVAQNVIVSSNYFNNLQEPLIVGGGGGQGNAANSNIVFINNLCSNAQQMVLIYQGSHIYVTNNYIHGGFPSAEFSNSGGQPSQGNTFFYNNTAVSVRGGLSFPASSTLLPYDDPSNQFPPKLYDDFFGFTNLVSYDFGYRQNIRTPHANSVWKLDDVTPSQIPPGATMLVSNITGATITVFRSTATPVTDSIINNRFLYYYWTGAQWSTNAPENVWNIGTLIN